MAGPGRVLGGRAAAWVAVVAAGAAAGADGPFRPAGTLKGHVDAAYAAAATPDGRRIVTGGFDHTVRVWDAATLLEVRAIPAHGNFVLAVAVAPDGARVVSGGLDKLAKIWEMPAAAPTRPPEPQPGPVRALAMSPDGARLAVASARTLRIAGVAPGTPPRDLPGHDGDLASAAWRRDGAEVASGDKAGAIRFWNPVDGAARGLVKTPADAVLGLAYLPDGLQVISAGSDGLARLWQLPPAEPLLVEVAGRARGFAASADGARLAVSGDDRVVRVFDVAGALVREIAAGDRPVVAVALSEDGGRLAIATEGNSVRLVDISTGAEVARRDDLPGPASALAARGDGRQLAVGLGDGAIAVLQVDGAAIKDGGRLAGHASRVGALAFAAGEPARLVSGSDDGAAKLWDVAGSKAIREFAGAGSAVLRVAISRDGKVAATGSADKAVRVFGIDDAAARFTLAGLGGPVAGLALSADGSRAVAGPESGAVTMWDAKAGHALQSFDPPAGPLAGIALRGDGKSAAVATAGRLAIWTPSAVRVFAGHAGPVTAVAVTADGSRLVTASADTTARVFDVATGASRAVLSGHADALRAAVIAEAKDGPRAVTGSADKTYKVWSVADGKLLATGPARPSAIQSLAVDRAGARLAVGLADGGAGLFDLTQADPAKAEVMAMPGPRGPVGAVALTPDGATIAVGSDDATVASWKAAAAGPLFTLTGHQGQVYAAAWSPDGAMIATAAADKTARIWDPAEGRTLRTIEKAAESVVYAAAFSPKSDILATGGDDKVIRLWNPSDGKEIRALSGHGAAVYSLAFRPDGTLLASGSIDKTVRLWNPADGAEKFKLSGHPDDVYAVAFRPDGTALASLGYGGNLLLWDVATGKEIGRTKVAPGIMTYGLAWMPDGKRVVVCGSDGTGYLFEVP